MIGKFQKWLFDEQSWWTPGRPVPQWVQDVTVYALAAAVTMVVTVIVFKVTGILP